MSDKLDNNIWFLAFNLVDEYNREVLGIHISMNILFLRVIRYINQLAEWHCYPQQIRLDNVSAFTLTIFSNWTAKIDKGHKE
ncbi:MULTISPECIES: hypothetical protein [unclassified Psychrobacter]|uniref:hypothetical protein n=1 Tax=unclassified Psychrobacter TaxID=196806 RepID=UPI003F479CD3